MPSQATQPACFILFNSEANERDRFPSMAMIHLLKQIDNEAYSEVLVLRVPQVLGPVIRCLDYDLDG